MSHKFIQHLSQYDFWNSWVPTIRSGPTGIGATLEHLLDIPENSRKDADLHGVEVKASRIEDGWTASLVTLFTSSPSLPKKKYGHFLIDNFGYDDGQGYKRFYGWDAGTVTVKADLDGIQFLDGNKTLVQWNSDRIQARLDQKLSILAHVQANTKTLSGTEHFCYSNKIAMYSGTSYAKFAEMVNSGEVKIEFRMKKSSTGKLRDHGTAFRASDKAIHKLYQNVRYLEL